MPELLVEILSEEIPARMQKRAAEDLRAKLVVITDAWALAARSPGIGVETFVTPRRLGGVVRNLPRRQPDTAEERRGPRVGAPAAAIEGFCQANGLVPDALEVRETEKGAFHFAVIHRKGRETALVLAEQVAELIRGFAWPKSMRWANTQLRWVRPIHGLLCVFDRQPVPGGVGFGTPDQDGREIHLPFTNKTVGHRFLAPELIRVRDFADYRAKLKKANVLIDLAERRARIEKDGARFARKEGLTIKPDPELMDECAGLVEWPVVLMGRIDESFMDLWPEVLATVMRHHQKYLALLDKGGNLAPRFLVVAGTRTRDRGRAIAAGNERVLKARLADAKYFRDQDLSQPLESYVPRLDKLVFHARLGTMREKTDRIEGLAEIVGASIPGADPMRVRRAAHLCKADLVTQMVVEFPELQGVMGGRYAAYGSSHENPSVATAIAEHYAPRGPGDKCPTAPASVAVALADKIDSLVGFWAIGERPTGTKDPFGLRRATQGVIRLILENSIRVSLTSVFERSFQWYVRCFQMSGRTMFAYNREGLDGKNQVFLIGHSNLRLADVIFTKKYEYIGVSKWEKGIKFPGGGKEPASEGLMTKLHWHVGQIGALLDFFAERLKVHLRDQGIRHDIVSAVFSQSQEAMAEAEGILGDVDLVRVVNRVEALSRFLGTDDGADLLVAYRRASNIVRIEQKKDARVFEAALYDPGLGEGTERALSDSLGDIDAGMAPLLEAEKFEETMELLSRLRGPVDAFFDRVTVNVDDADVRENRLRLLARINVVMNEVADFSTIEG